MCYLWTATRAVGITFDWRADTAFNFCRVANRPEAGKLEAGDPHFAARGLLG